MAQTIRAILLAKAMATSLRGLRPSSWRSHGVASLLVTGATAVIRHASRADSRLASAWLRQLLSRKPRKLAAVALANKMARIVWAVMTSGEVYRYPPAAAVVASAAVS